MIGLNVHKNIPASVTKLTISLRALTWQLTNSSQLTLEGEPPAWGQKHACIDACIDHHHQCCPTKRLKRLIHVSHTDDLGWYITSNQQGKMFVQTRSFKILVYNFIVYYYSVYWLLRDATQQKNFLVNRDRTRLEGRFSSIVDVNL